jgi:hypothetical protein
MGKDKVEAEKTATKGQEKSKVYAYHIVNGEIVDPVPALQVDYDGTQLETEDKVLKKHRSLESLIEFYGKDDVLKEFLAARRINLRKFQRTAIKTNSTVSEDIHSSNALKSTRKPAEPKLGRSEFIATLAKMSGRSVDSFTPEELATIDAKFTK